MCLINCLNCGECFFWGETNYDPDNKSVTFLEPNFYVLNVIADSFSKFDVYIESCFCKKEVIKITLKLAIYSITEILEKWNKLEAPLWSGCISDDGNITVKSTDIAVTFSSPPKEIGSIVSQMENFEQNGKKHFIESYYFIDIDEVISRFNILNESSSNAYMKFKAKCEKGEF
jgi:hypothetical protein